MTLLMKILVTAWIHGHAPVTELVVKTYPAESTSCERVVHSITSHAKKGVHLSIVCASGLTRSI
jgi:hypothetical protein